LGIVCSSHEASWPRCSAAIAASIGSLPSRRERSLAGAGQHDAAHLRVGGELAQAFHQRLAHLRAEGVQLVRLIQGDDTHLPVAFHENGAGLHRSPPSVQGAGDVT
jgi:hypothetical protein